ncbi:hypothetical protein TUMEXPCC7403_17835 [Tumidithrix helvetica PCC 7403]|uniref:SGNH/GDSL hydrolase family protein n=1 Tax=Tumidithrix helvetica TaxID=3457545 RepID=UPI003CB0212B
MKSMTRADRKFTAKAASRDEVTNANDSNPIAFTHQNPAIAQYFYTLIPIETRISSSPVPALAKMQNTVTDKAIVPSFPVTTSSSRQFNDLDSFQDSAFVRNSIANFSPSVPALVQKSILPTGAVFSASTPIRSDSPFSKLYVFGDSLSDQGNIFNITSFAQKLGANIPIVPSDPYFAGRFSNGPNWIDYLSVGLGLPLQVSSKISFLSPTSSILSPIALTSSGLGVSPFFHGATVSQGVNFAFGDAQTGYTSGPVGTIAGLIPGVLQQVSWFIKDHISVGKAADSKALYVILAGGNDYLDSSNVLTPLQSVTNLTTAIASLYSLGARNFLIPNLPDLGKTPHALAAGAAEESRLTNLTLAHDRLLGAAVWALAGALPDSHFIPLDFYSKFNNVIANPSRYGFTNVTDPFLDPNAMVLGDPNAVISSQNPNQYLFWDDVHPTTAGHFILGVDALVTIAQSLAPKVESFAAPDRISLSLGSQSALERIMQLPDNFIPTFDPLSLVKATAPALPL